MAGVRLVQLADAKFKNKFYFPHPNRLWEYGSAIQAHLDRWGDAKVLNGVVADESWALDVLDIGGGYGALGPTLATELNENVTEIEIDQNIVNKRNALGIPNLKAELGSALDLTGEKLYQSVFCISVIEHIPEWQKALAGLMKSVASEGLLVLTTDFGEVGKEWANDSERDNKFTSKHIQEMQSLLEQGKFALKIDPTFHGAQVWDYTFFRIIAERQ